LQINKTVFNDYFQINFLFEQQQYIEKKHNSPSTAPQQPHTIVKKNTTKRQNNVDTATYNSIVETKHTKDFLHSLSHCCMASL